MGHVESKTRSLGQILEKACVHSRGHIFGPIIMKHGQDVCLGKILYKCENGACRVKNRSLGQILEKPCVQSRGHVFGPIIMKTNQNVCLDEILDKIVNGPCRIKN